MTKKTTRTALAVTLCLGAATAALAQPGRGGWDNIGTITIDGQMGRGGPDRPGPGGMDRDTRRFDLGGSVERLQLRADRSDIQCRSVRATYGNGRSNEIYQGRLQQGRPVTVDIPGTARDLRALSFTCASINRRDALIHVSADVGRYRSDWMAGPNWRGTWARMFNWGSNTINNWQMIGSERFEGRGDVESVFAGFRGRRADSIALMPTNADARCSTVNARFDNGRTQRLNIRNGDTLRRGMYHQVDLPGNMRNLQSLSLRCSATNARSVTINIYTGG